MCCGPAIPAENAFALPALQGLFRVGRHAAGEGGGERRGGEQAAGGGDRGGAAGVDAADRGVAAGGQRVRGAAPRRRRRRRALPSTALPSRAPGGAGQQRSACAAQRPSTASTVAQGPPGERGVAGSAGAAHGRA